MPDQPSDPRPLEAGDPIPTSLPGAPPDPTRPSLARATAVMSAGTALSRVTGFVRLAIIAWAIGGTESKLPDTYNLANSMPNIIYQLVLGEILATVFVPVFVEYITTRDREESWRLASTILNLTIIFAAVVSAITVLIAPWLIQIYTFRVEDPTLRLQQQEVGAFFLRLFMPQMIFYGAGAVLTGLLNAHRRFAAPMFAPVLNNIIVSATFIAFRILHDGDVPALTSLTTGDKLLLGGGTSLGVVAMTVVLWPAVRRLPGRYGLRDLAWRHPAVRHVGNLAKFSIGYVIVNQIGLWVVYMLANGVQGGVSAYNSAWILYQLPYGIFAVSVMTALVPNMSEHHVRGDRAAFRRDVSLGLRTTAFIVIPAAAGFVALSRPLIRVLLEHGVFGAGSTDLFADTFLLMSIGLVAYAAFQQIMRAFYAMQDTRTPWLVNIAAVATTVATAFPAFAVLGVPGLGLAHAITYTTGTIVGGALLWRRAGGLEGSRLLRSHLKIAAASAVTGACAWLVARAFGSAVGVSTVWSQVGQVSSAVLVGLVLYGVLSKLLRVEEFTTLTEILARRFARRGTT